MVRSSGIVVVEGSLDTILNHQHGLKNTVGILGSKISEIQAQQIANMMPKRIYTMFDADAAGVGTTISVHDRLGRVHQVKVCRYPKGKSDPAELTEKEARRVIERAIPYVKFQQSAAVLRAVKSRSRNQEEISFG